MAAIPSNWRPKFLRGHSSTDLRTFMAAVENENTEHMFFKVGNLASSSFLCATDINAPNACETE